VGHRSIRAGNLLVSLYILKVCCVRVVCGVRVCVDDPGPETKALTELGLVGGDRYGSREY